MTNNDYLFIYERIDGSQFEVINRLSSSDVAQESAKLSLSRHADLRRCTIYRLSLINEIDKTKP